MRVVDMVLASGDTASMPFDRDEWLLDPQSRQRWVRTAGLSELVKMLLRTPATALECLACLLDEVLSRSAMSPRRRSAFKRATLGRAKAEQRALRKWLDHSLRRDAPPRAVRSLWFFVGEGAPYWLRLAGSRLVARSESYEWAVDRTWEAKTQAPSELLARIEELVPRVDPETAKEIGYLLPIAYPAFVVNELLREHPRLFMGDRKERAVVVGYEDGDFFPIRITRSG
jgi:hypothetical protein